MSAPVTCLGALMSALSGIICVGSADGAGDPVTSQPVNATTTNQGVFVAKAALKPKPAPNSHHYALYYNDPATKKWSVGMKTRGATKEQLHDIALKDRRTYLDHSEPPGLRKYAPMGTDDEGVMNYTIVPFGFDPNVPTPIPVPEYCLLHCIGTGWVPVDHNANYETLRQEMILMGGIEADCGDGCPGSTAMYYKICPGPCPAPGGTMPIHYYWSVIRPGSPGSPGPCQCR
jgi:hypothetical protein